MKQQIPWWILIGGGIIFYGINYIIGGIIGSAFELIGFIMIVMGIIELVRKSRKGK